MRRYKKKMHLRYGKKGSYILEAAIVLPVIMLAVITAILIIMFFYTQMTEQCRLHKALRAEAGRITGKTTYMDDGDKYLTEAQIDIDRNVLESKVYGKKYLVMEHKGLLNKKGTFTVEGSCYAADGPAYIRYSSTIRGEKDE